LRTKGPVGRHKEVIADFSANSEEKAFMNGIRVIGQIFAKAIRSYPPCLVTAGAVIYSDSGFSTQAQVYPLKDFEIYR